MQILDKTIRDCITEFRQAGDPKETRKPLSTSIIIKTSTNLVRIKSPVKSFIAPRSSSTEHGRDFSPQIVSKFSLFLTYTSKPCSHIPNQVFFQTSRSGQHFTSHPKNVFYSQPYITPPPSPSQPKYFPISIGKQNIDNLTLTTTAPSPLLLCFRKFSQSLSPINLVRSSNVVCRVLDNVDSTGIVL